MGHGQLQNSRTRCSVQRNHVADFSSDTSMEKLLPNQQSVAHIPKLILEYFYEDWMVDKLQEPGLMPIHAAEC